MSPPLFVCSFAPSTFKSAMDRLSKSSPRFLCSWSGRHPPLSVAVGYVWHLLLHSGASGTKGCMVQITEPAYAMRVLGLGG